MADHETTRQAEADTEAEPTEHEPTEHEPTEHVGEHEAPDGAPLHPLINLSRDPHPGQPDHARPEN